VTKNISLTNRSFLDVQSLTREEIELILSTGTSIKEIMNREIKKVPALRGKTVALMFFEPSTRTRTSFDLAAKLLSADTVSFTPAGSSMTKGETLLDTVKNIISMGPDLVVMRHAASGAPYFIAKNINVPVINAGDGMHEHPTQAMLDLFTVKEKKGKIEGLKVAIVGDILHSRVARSDVYAFQKLGASVRFVGPPTFIPEQMKNFNVPVYYNLKEGISGVDVIIMLRIQLERQGACFFPTLREYYNLYGLKKEMADMLGDSVIIMHPGPLNRGVEIDPEIADGKNSVILNQVTNGVAIRAALLYLILGGRQVEDVN
jgi:aspartate carbamoyltransferase catalytic subunit